MKRLLLMGSLAASIASCHTAANHSITASEFQQSCTVASDCVPVYEGPLGCCGGPCPNAAVNHVGYSAYEIARANRTPSCYPQPPCPPPEVACIAGATCSNGTCVVAPFGTDDAGDPCTASCPATAAHATIVVTTTPAMAVSGVQATLSGPENGTMSCAPNFDAVLCEWPAGVAVTPGTYSLQVSAPGYQTRTVQVEVNFLVSPPPCGCTAGHVEPSTVMLSPQ